MIHIIITIIAILCVIYYYRRNDKLPPGESGWPIIGYIAKKGDSLNNTVTKLRTKHGDIFTIQRGSRLFLFLCDYSVIKRYFSKAEFSGRPNFFTTMITRNFKRHGIVASEGARWSENRRFALKVLHDFGMGKSVLIDLIDIEVNHLISHFKKSDGKPFAIDWSLNIAVLNTLLQLTIGRRYDIDDPKMKEIVEDFSNLIKGLDGRAQMLTIFPWLEKIVPSFLFDRVFEILSINDPKDRFISYLKDIIHEHKKTLNTSKPRDYIDMYLIEYAKERKLDDNYDDLICILIDMLIAGSDTSSTTIRWYCLHVANCPEIQTKIYAEITNAVPKDRLPNLSDKDNLPYFQASICEINRLISLVPFGLYHSTMKDAELDKYIIPKGTVVASARELCHKDPKIWKHPDRFYPEHFLDSGGNISMPKEGYAPFSLGRRQCLGESMAKMELFLFLAAIIQTFEILPMQNKPVNLTNDPKIQFFNSPISQNLIFKLRP